LQLIVRLWSGERMDRGAVLAAFDAQIRRRPDGRVERDGGVVRFVSDGGWSGVSWSDLDEASADEAIAAQFGRFEGAWEWKHYSYDSPADLPERLIAAGLTPEPAEALMVAGIADLSLGAAPPPGVELVEAVDAAGIAAVVSVHDEVFGGDHSALMAEFAGMPGVALLALAGRKPIAASRVEFHPGTEFASLWGGGTLPEWRGRGVFRAMVAYRAALAAAEGYRYLQVDALPPSRPILQRLGFVELATTTPFTHPGGGNSFN
jgi:GNAT superfamily N-acetyltransferase